MGTIRYAGELFRIDDFDAQLLALVAAQFNARDEAFTIRVAGGRRDRERWLTVNPGIPLEVDCPAIPMRSGESSPYSDGVKEALAVANDEFHIVAVRRSSES